MFTFSYVLRIESMLLKAEFDENMSNLERSADDMLSGGEGKNYLVFNMMHLVNQ